MIDVFVVSIISLKSIHLTDIYIYCLYNSLVLNTNFY
jgi:hypothetical protein